MARAGASGSVGANFESLPNEDLVLRDALVKDVALLTSQRLGENEAGAADLPSQDHEGEDRRGDRGGERDVARAGDQAAGAGEIGALGPESDAHRTAIPEACHIAGLHRSP